MTITSKQQRFAEEYLIDLNATQAAVRAGYSLKTAKSQGQRLLTNVDIQAFITEKRQKISQKTELNIEWVLNNLKTVVERCMQIAPVLDRRGQQVYVENGEGAIVPAFTFNANGANKALELVGKHLGMFQDKKDPTSPSDSDDDPLVDAIADSAAGDWADTVGGSNDGQSSTIQQEATSDNELVAPQQPCLGF